MESSNKSELHIMIQEAIAEELNKRDFLTRDEISRISRDSCMITMDTTFQLMGLKFTVHGKPDFETIRNNNDFVHALRVGSEQTKGLIWKSCVGTFCIAIISLLGTMAYDYIVHWIETIKAVTK